MQDIKAVLFDLDGTINNTVNDIAASANYALGLHGFPTHPAEAFKLFAGSGTYTMLQRAMPPEHKEDGSVELIIDDYLKHYAVHSMDTTAPYDGVRELIDALRDLGYKTAVVTNKPDDVAKQLIADMFPGKFDAVVGQRDGVPVKPDPAMPRLAMSELGVSPEQCVFVGDSGVDIQTGKNCGAYPVGVLWGFRGRDELLQNGAKELISEPSELLGILARR
jgi:phosphoglycolate phosphatase